jgi:hypothetical protein
MLRDRFQPISSINSPLSLSPAKPGYFSSLLPVNNNNNLLYHTLPLLLMNLIVRDANISYGLLNWHSRYPAPRPYETTEENFDFSCTRQWKTIKRCDRCTLELLPKRPIMNHYARAKHSSFLLRFRRLLEGSKRLSAASLGNRLLVLGKRSGNTSVSKVSRSETTGKTLVGRRC